MGTYHFISGPSGAKVTYGKKSFNHFGVFLKSEHCTSGEKNMIIANCSGSLMVIDTARDISTNPINKLHIGELVMRRAHAESYEHSGLNGFRVDLASFDIHYAKVMLQELLLWKDAAHRRELIEDYEKQKKPDGSYPSYYMSYRVAQLKISPEGLETKIKALREHMTWLKKPEQKDRRRFVSEKVKGIESDSYKMVQLMGFEVQGLEAIRAAQKNRGELTRKKENMPKIIHNEDIIGLASRVQRNARETLDFICPQINVIQVRDYWKDVASWENS